MGIPEYMQYIINCVIGLATLIAAVCSAVAAVKSSKAAEAANLIVVHEQARKVAIWIQDDCDEPGLQLILNNASDMPIYDVYAGAELAYPGRDNEKPDRMSMTVSGPSNQGSHSLGTVHHGVWLVGSYPPPGMSNKLGGILVYRDINGDTWFINAQGKRHDLHRQDPAEFLNLYKNGFMPHGDENLVLYSS